jgi:hypothetical protein
MSVITAVPLNTMLADLDETLRALLRRELGEHGFEAVEIAFDAPTRDWSASQSSPTVNLFLYDLRESLDHRPVEWVERSVNGKVREARPPLRLNATFAVTAWTREVQDEHRLLSQTLSVLYAYHTLPEELLSGTLATRVAQSYPVTAQVAQGKGDGKADFWGAVGGEFKVSFDYVVTVSCEPGVEREQPPEVRTQTVRTGLMGIGVHEQENHRVGGVVRDADGAPSMGAWVALPELGKFAVTDTGGRFRLDQVPAGRYTCVARADDGEEAQEKLIVPGDGVELTLGSRPARRRARVD